MELVWYALLGLFFATYLVLAGYDYGVGLMLATDGGEHSRRRALNAVGPFFLGNEVWLVAAVGILFGAFPMLEGELLSGLYPAVVTALTGVILVTAGVQLRSRPTGAAGRSGWDRVVIGGSALAALGWGAVLAGLLQGVPLRADGHVAGVGHLVTPFVAASGLALVGLVAVHGAVFLALRLPGKAGERHRRLARRLVPVALVAAGTAAVLGLLTDRVRETVQQPVAALALPVLLVAASTWPYALVSSVDPSASLTVADAAASTPTLRLLSWLLIPLLPALLGFQVMSWWVFRGRIDGRAPVYW
ncbi:cytochrome d ubiquinol oxidase subunit II [Micromonospora sp. NPDC050397]|uniref:cytochrome d ubiquinol oxidase subunit II n=1 Tax=Micromonospora sp. NPDC050397 TaxID=3364279 RepID=UPI00384FF15D